MLSKPNLSYPADGSQNTSHFIYLSVSFIGNNTYDFELAENASFNDAVRFYNEDQSVRVDRLKLNTTYYWRAKRFYNGDSSSWSNARSFSTASVLIVSSNGTLAPSSSFGINACDHSHYQFQLGTDTLFASPLILDRVITIEDSIGYAELIYDSLYFSTQYYSRWRSWEGSDTSAWTSYIPGMIQDTLRHLNPSGNLNTTNVSLSWANSGPNALFEYQLDTTDQFNSPVLFSDTSWINYNHDFTLLDFDQHYYWRVRVSNRVDTSSWQGNSFVTEGAKNKSVYLPSFKLPVDTRFSLTMLNSADSLQVQWSTSSSFNQNIEESWVPAGQDADTARQLHYEKTYYFRYRAVHQRDSGEWSQVTYERTLEYLNINTPLNNQNDVSVHSPITWSTTRMEGTHWIHLQLSDSSDYSTGLLVDTLVDARGSAYLSGFNMKYGTTYYLRTRLINSIDTSSWSSDYYQHKFSTLEKPVLTSPSSSLLIPRNCQESLKWIRDVSTLFYRVQFSTDSLFQQNVLDTLAPFANGEVELMDLKFGEKYFWRVKAIEMDDSSSWSDVWYFVVRNAPKLDLPKNKKKDISTMPSLDWSSITGTSGFVIQVSADSLFNTIDYQKSEQVNNAFFHFLTEPLRFNNRYFWRVRVYHSQDTSDWSEIWSFTTIERRSPIPVYPYQAQDSVYVSPTLHWEKYSIANSYRFKLFRDSLLTDLMYDLVRQDTLTLTLGLKPYTTYFWTVQGRNSSGQEFYDPSETMKFTTGGPLPAPILMEPANGSVIKSNGAAFKWTIVAGASYQIQFSSSTNFSQSGIIAVNSNSSNQTIGFGGPYYWRVRSMNPQHVGDWSDTFSVSFLDATAVSDLKKEVLVCYPNPVLSGQKMQFAIETKGLEQTISLFAVDGSLIFQKISNDNSIKLEGVRPGFYTVLLEQDGQVYRAKIIVR